MQSMASVSPSKAKFTIVRRLLLALHWTQQRGWSWVLQRARNELSMPVSRLGRLIRNAIAAAVGGVTSATAALFRRLPAVETDSKHTLYFFYDLQICPIAYDMAIFLSAAELERRRRGLAQIHVVIVPGKRAGMRLERPDYDAVVDEHARRWRLHNLVIPAIGLLPTCAGYTVCSSRTHAWALYLLFARHKFPAGWEVSFPIAPPARTVRDAALAGEVIFPLLKAPRCALKYADRFVAAMPDSRKLVLITLRHYAYTPARNSNIGEWVAFADSLDPDCYVVAFVLDTDTALGRIPAGVSRYAICHAASWSLHLRMALYERAYVNLAVMHGPVELCCHNEACRYITFFPLNSAPLTSTSNVLVEGFEIGKQLPFARPWQRLVWQRDDRETIREAFAQMVEVLRDQDALYKPSGTTP